MSHTPSDYQPINCDYHDLLEVHATKRAATQISFRDEDGSVKSVNAVITDLFARAGADYLTLSTGKTLRLDHLIEVDSAKLADY